MEKGLESGERILVCLSSSPSNQKVIDAAVKMAEAFHAVLTAIYVKTSNYDSLPESDKIRLQNNIKFAEQNGATIITIIGNDVPVQIAEYAHISGTTVERCTRNGVSFNKSRLSLLDYIKKIGLRISYNIAFQRYSIQSSLQSEK